MDGGFLHTRTGNFRPSAFVGVATPASTCTTASPFTLSTVRTPVSSRYPSAQPPRLLPIEKQKAVPDAGMCVCFVCMVFY